MSRRSKAQKHLEETRRAAEARLEELRANVERETGWRPSLRTWGPALVAVALGATVAFGNRALASGD